MHHLTVEAHKCLATPWLDFGNDLADNHLANHGTIQYSLGVGAWSWDHEHWTGSPEMQLSCNNPRKFKLQVRGWKMKMSNFDNNVMRLLPCSWISLVATCLSDSKANGLIIEETKVVGYYHTVHLVTKVMVMILWRPIEQKPVDINSEFAIC